MQKTKLKGIYAITPSGLKKKILLRKITELLKVGIKVLQFRDKERDFSEKLIVAKQISRICERFKCTFIINDDPLLAKEVGADGVHLGQEDMSYEEARNILGTDSIIGISCQNNLDFALKAEAQGADYIAFGSVFNTKTKNKIVKSSVDEIESLISQINIPTVALGGINLSNINQLSSTHADMIAISSGLFDEESSSDTASAFIGRLRELNLFF